MELVYSEWETQEIRLTDAPGYQTGASTSVSVRFPSFQPPQGGKTRLVETEAGYWPYYELAGEGSQSTRTHC